VARVAAASAGAETEAAAFAPPSLVEEPLEQLSLDDFDTLPVAPSAAPATMSPPVAQPERADSTSLSFEEELLAPPPAPPGQLEATPTTPAAKAPPAAASATASALKATSASTTAASTAATNASTAAAAAASAASPPMDRDFIARNQVVERYLSGRLPLKGATDFERFCRENPAVLDELGLPERVNAGLRLLEASGKPEPWQEVKQPFWQKPHVTIGLIAAVILLAGGLWFSTNDGSSKATQIKKLQSQASERPLDPATSTREVRLLPSREGGSNTPAITIGGGPAQLVDFKIDESRSPYKIFRVTIDRIDQGRVAVISDLAKDSNGHLRIALNSSALGPGNYQLTIEGLTWRGDVEPDSWITIGIQR
jgi:hypothetical protein